MTAPGILEQVGAAVRHVEEKVPLRPRVGLVLGSGLGDFARSLTDAVAVPYSEIPHFPTSTAVGHRGELLVGRAEGVPVAVMAGRVHYYEGYSPAQVVFPVRVLGGFGVRILVLTNAAGSVNVNFRPGELMIIQDHINYTGMHPLIGPNEEKLGPRFFDMSEAYDAKLRELAERACWKSGVTARKGVYIAFSGPSYETPAEIKMARNMGADAVGMSTVPEVIAARHVGIRCLGISCISNYGAGVTKQKLDHREVLDVGRQAAEGLRDALGHILVEAEKMA